MAERTSPNATRTGAASPWIVLEGAGFGGLLAIGLTLRDLFDVAIDDRIHGVSVPTIHRFLATDFRFEVVRAIVELFALATVVGTSTGALVAFVEWLRLRTQRVEGLSFGFRMLKLAGLIGALWGWIVLLDIAVRPALHQAMLFQRGGVRAWLQIAVADGLGRSGVIVCGLVAVLFYWFGPARLTRVESYSRLRVGVVGSVRRLVEWCQRLRSGNDATLHVGELRVRIRRLVGLGTRSWRVRGVAALVAAVAALSSFGFAFDRRGQRQEADRRPNIVILAADSLRPDRLDSARAPHLAELVGRATSFERAYTPLARTFPAWVSIATGQYPHHHGIRHMFPRWETREQALDTMVRHFDTAGYHTAVVGDFAADIFRRIDLGYRSVRTPTFTLRELVREHLLKNVWLMAFVRGRTMRGLVPVLGEISDATDPHAVSQLAIEEIERHRDEPFLLTVFYSTTHFPYAAPGPYHRRFRAQNYVGPYRYAKADTLAREERVSSSDVAQVRALYDGAVFATDEAMQTVLDALAERDLSRRTIVVVTADHGEELYEYGRTQGHGDHLRAESALRVPLVIFDPRKPAAHRIADPVSLVDLAPTLLDLAGIAALPRADGRSLAAAIDGVALTGLPVYSETGLWFTELIPEVPLSNRIPYPDLTQLTQVDREHGDQIVIRSTWEPLTISAKHRMIQDANWRLLYQPSRERVAFELCDLAQDPGCLRDCSAGHPEPFERLKMLFWRFASQDPAVLRHGDRLVPRTTAAQERP